MLKEVEWILHKVKFLNLLFSLLNNPASLEELFSLLSFWTVVSPLPKKFL